MAPEPSVSRSVILIRDPDDAGRTFVVDDGLTRSEIITLSAPISEAINLLRRTLFALEAGEPHVAFIRIGGARLPLEQWVVDYDPPNDDANAILLTIH